MSMGMAWAALEPETRQHIQQLVATGHPCGCHDRGARWFICDYHEGYDEGVAAMRSRV